MPPTLGGYSKPVRCPSSFSCCRRRLKFLGPNNSSSERWNELDHGVRDRLPISNNREQSVGYDYCCLALVVRCRDQQRDRAHVSRGFAATARSDRARRSDCLGGQFRRQVEAGHFLSAVPAAIALSRRLAHSEGGSASATGERSWNWRSASSCCTVVGVGYFINWMIPAMPLSVAFALAAIVSPTDPIAVLRNCRPRSDRQTADAYSRGRVAAATTPRVLSACASPSRPP